MDDDAARAISAHLAYLQKRMCQLFAGALSVLADPLETLNEKRAATPAEMQGWVAAWTDESDTQADLLAHLQRVDADFWTTTEAVLRQELWRQRRPI